MTLFASNVTKYLLMLPQASVLRAQFWKSSYVPEHPQMADFKLLHIRATGTPTPLLPWASHQSLLSFRLSLFLLIAATGASSFLLISGPGSLS